MYYIFFKEILEKLARDIRKSGENHRGFKVGAAKLVFDGSRYQIFLGANFMPKEAAFKICAEQNALLSMRLAEARSGFTCQEIIAIVVAGKKQPEPDKESGRKTLALHPCPGCRFILEAAPEVKDWTIIHTIGPRKANPQEEMSFRSLLQYHRRKG
jgi:cytidine deaminase